MKATQRVGNHYGAPLSVVVEDGCLVIRIGAQTLAHAVSYSDWAHDYEDDAGDYFRTFAITDAPMFAKDVLHAMLNEREDGSSSEGLSCPPSTARNRSRAFHCSQPFVRRRGDPALRHTSLSITQHAAKGQRLSPPSWTWR